MRAVYALLGSDYPMARPLGVVVGDTIVQEADDDDLLPGTYPVGTLSRDSVEDSIEDLYVYIKAVGRTYGDSIVLRWAVESYPEWDRLNRTGYDVLRHTEGEGEFLLDTLATGIRPMSLADFRRCYPDTIDSLAYMAMGAIYGEGDMTPEMTNYEPGSIGSFVELEQDRRRDSSALSSLQNGDPTSPRRWGCALSIRRRRRERLTPILLCRLFPTRRVASSSCQPRWRTSAMRSMSPLPTT